MCTPHGALLVSGRSLYKMKKRIFTILALLILPVMALSAPTSKIFFGEVKYTAGTDDLNYYKDSTQTLESLTISSPLTFSAGALGVNTSGFVTSSSGATSGSELAVYSGITGSVISKLSSTGFTYLTSGVVSAIASTGTGSVVLATNPTLSGLTMADTTNVALSTGTGTKWGTATGQKQAFYNSTPIVQPVNTVAINDVLANLGLRASGGSSNFTTTVKTPAATTSISSINSAAGTAPTTPVNGDIWNDSATNMMAFFNGNTLYQSGNLYTATAAVTLASTTPTTAFSTTKIGSTTIGASSLKVGQKFYIWGAGYYSTPALNTATVTIAAKIGSVTISTVTTAAFPASATNLPYDFNLQCTVQAVGSGTSAKIVCDGGFNYATALSAVAKTSNSLSTVGQIGFDSTASQALDVLVSWSAVTTQTATVQQSKIDFL